MGNEMKGCCLPAKGEGYRMEIQIQVLSREQLGVAGLEGMLSPGARELPAGRVLCMAAYLDGECCGVLGAEVIDEAELELASLYVVPELRGQGIGSQLLYRLHQWSGQRGVLEIGVYYQCARSEEGQLHRFFLKNGYQLPTPGNVMYTVPIAGLKDSYLGSLPVKKYPAQVIMPFKHLPEAVREDYERRVGTEIPKWLAMDAAEGDLLMDFCLCYVREGQVVSFIVMAVVDGKLNLCSAYIKPGLPGTALIALLQQALQMLPQEPRTASLTELKICAVNEQSRKLLLGLLQGVKLQQETVYHTQYQVAPAATYLHEEENKEQVRLQTLASLLAENGYRNMLHFSTGTATYLEVETQPGQAVSFRYQLDTEGNRWLVAMSGEEMEPFARNMEEDGRFLAQGVVTEWILPLLRASAEQG